MDGDRGAGRSLGDGDALDLHGVVAVGLDGDHVADLLGRAGRVAAAAERGRVLLAAVERGRHAGLAGCRVEGDPPGRVLPGGGHLQHLGRVDGVAVSVRVTPPALLGRDLPEVRAATPEVALDTDRP